MSTTAPTATTSRSLSPSSPPFLFPKSSPTLTSSSDSASGTLLSSTYVESTSTLSSTAPSDKLKLDNQRQGKDVFPSSITTTTAKSFGAGWKSSSPFVSQLSSRNNNDASRHLAFENDPFHSQTRSSDLPMSYQVNPTPFLHRINTTTHELPHDFELYTPTSPNSVGHPFSPYPITPNDEIYHHHRPSVSSIDIELEDNPSYYIHTHPDTNALNHHQSVPNLPYVRQGLARRPSGVSVRFTDKDISTQDFDQNDIASQRGLRRMPGFNFGQIGARTKLMSSKSMPIIPMVGEGRNVFIHCVDNDLSEEDLRVYASEFGEVVSVKIPARTTRPHAFVMFKKPDQASSFIMHLKVRNIECEFGKEDYQVKNKALEDPNSANLYISGLPTSLTYDELAEILLPGKVCSWKPLVDEAGNRRGPIMARLQTRVQANDVIRKLNGRYYQGMSERLQVRIADSDEQKHFKRHQSSWSERSNGISLMDQLNHTSLIPEHAIALMNEDAEDVELIHTRDYLATQLEAIEHQLARTQIKPRSVVFPASEEPRYRSDIIGPKPTGIGHTAAGWGHRHTSSSFLHDSFGTWPDWTGAGAGAMNGKALPNTNPFGNFNDQYRQQAVSLTNSSGPEKSAGGWSGLHHVRSSPELGLRMVGASDFFWKSERE
ncbi:uncharacterized protein IL334_001696 [Kwoniella shivajii]|uniref:RRM domain-containing protein n=1 Tax=Kwoniella shivajii TaxID=564305 RepID=A0ABZ1CSM2_9TREE|nr:hypothetical protein IL334_001696 [Kwoniella shivajii]